MTAAFSRRGFPQGAVLELLSRAPKAAASGRAEEDPGAGLCPGTRHPLCQLLT